MVALVLVSNLVNRVKEQRSNGYMYTICLSNADVSRQLPTRYRIAEIKTQIGHEVQKLIIKRMLDTVAKTRTRRWLTFAPAERNIAKRPILHHAKGHNCHFVLKMFVASESIKAKKPPKEMYTKFRRKKNFEENFSKH